MGELKKMYDDIWKNKEVPPDFGNTKMTAIHKNKGSKKDPKNVQNDTNIQNTFKIEKRHHPSKNK